jgi:ABC-2 type transport system permease protein
MNRRVAALIRKEFLHVRRDPRTLYLAVGMPTVLLLLFGYAITLDIVKIPLGVFDQDQTARSRDLISHFSNTRYFRFQGEARNRSEVRDFLDRGQVKVFLVIPPEFGRRIARGERSPLQILLDGSDSNQAGVALGYARSIAQGINQNIFVDAVRMMGNPRIGERVPPVEARVVALFNPQLKSQIFVIPGLIAVIMMMMGTMLTALTVSREWERGTMEQLLVTPARPLEIVIGKTVPYFILGLIQLVSIILVGWLWFRVPFVGSHLFLLACSCIFLLTALGTGLLISILARSQQLATQLSFLLSMLPSMILSGFIFPVASMPKPIQLVTVLVPAKYYIRILRGILLKGTGIVDLWPEGLALAIFAAATIAVCARRFRTQIS